MCRNSYTVRCKDLSQKKYLIRLVSLCKNLSGHRRAVPMLILMIKKEIDKLKKL